MMVFDFILLPLLACLLLVLLNVYFGIHVIRREIIFIDIALAQIAAFGSTVALVLFEPSGAGSGAEAISMDLLAYFFSIAFVGIAAYFFSLFQHREIGVPLEAIIGITYALATCATVIILDASAGADIHVHDMLVGSILWVAWHDIVLLVVLVVLIGGFHLIYRRQFIQLSEAYGNTNKTPKHPKKWDFLFYFTLGLFIIQAVHVAGILTVFALLIIPASISTLFSKGWWPRLWIGWLAGFAVIVTGLILSVEMDVPFSPVMITLLGAILLGGSILKRLFPKRV
jgi:zinc/manganese transport system permease protein